VQNDFKIMSKILKTILITSVIVFGLGLFGAPSVKATAVDGLVVEYWSGSEWLPLSGPIFSETNFLPGEGVTRLIRVTNNSGQTQRIATEAINENDPDHFASQLNLTIKESSTIIFNDTLKKFFDQGETYLSSLASGAQTQYDFTIAFNSGAGNDYQEKALGFDILVGFEGTEGGLPLPLPGGGTGGGGGGLPAGLTIINEAATSTTETTATITWLTSYAATSQVIYGTTASEKHTLDLTDTTGSPPKYGYEYTTSESNTSPKVTFHIVTITGLTSGTTYYYRAISHASLAISVEHSFTTLKVSNEESEGGEEVIEETGAEQGTGAGEGIQPGEEIGGVGEAVEGTGGLVAGAEAEEGGVEGVGEKQPEVVLNQFLAAIGNFFNLQNLWWILIIIIVILIILFFLSRKKKE